MKRSLSRPKQEESTTRRADEASVTQLPIVYGFLAGRFGDDLRKTNSRGITLKKNGTNGSLYNCDDTSTDVFKCVV